MKKILPLILLSAFLGSCCGPYELKTCYMVDPVGIDEQPVFSYRFRGSKEQSAYQLRVYNGDTLIWDSGRVNSKESVCLPFGGGKLEPQTHYSWKARTWNERGRKSFWSSKAYFDTGISSWEQAQWIYSDKHQVSKYLSNYIIKYSLSLAEGSPGAGLIFGAKSENDYIALELGNDHFLRIFHVKDGIRKEDACQDVSQFLKSGKPQDFTVDVFASQYCRKYNINLSINGLEVKNLHKKAPEQIDPLKKIALPGKEGEFVVDFSDGGLYVESRLYGIGWLGKGTITGLSITDRAWKQTIFSDPQSHDFCSMNCFYPGEGVGAPIFRKEFSVEKKVKRAILYASSKGIYECQINSQMVSDGYYNPGWCEYGKRMFYNCFDVTKLINKGCNRWEATLGQGWWSGPLGYSNEWENQYGTTQAFLGKLVLEYSDGSSENIFTDSSWSKYDDGPIIENSFQNGEEYDARKTIPDEFSEKVLSEGVDSSLLWQSYIGEMVSCKETLCAQSVSSPSEGVYIYDMGVNLVGIPSIELCIENGKKVTLRYGEMLWPEIIPSEPVEPYTVEDYQNRQGTLYTDNYRSALSTDCIIGNGKSLVFEPRFTCHGYRYVEIRGLKEALDCSKVRALVLDGMEGGAKAEIETSSALVNQLFSNILRGQKGNFLAVPTDCPQRDERLGYTGDGQVFATSAMYNFGVDPFYRRWLLSVRDAQNENGNFSDFAPNLGIPNTPERGQGNIGWADAGILIPWQMYLQYGDKQILRDSYPSMERYMKYLESKTDDFIMPFVGLGDWLAYEKTSQELVHTCFFALDAKIMADASDSLGLSEGDYYRKLYSNIKTAFNKNFVDSLGRTYIPKGREKGIWIITRVLTQDESEDTQASYVMGLAAGLFDDPQRAADRLSELVKLNGNKLSTGFLATPYINKVLSQYGHNDVAYDLLLQQECPSWLYPVTQGATTIWERWNSYTRENGFGKVDMNSFNHYSYGAIEEWMIQNMLGIKVLEPGYKSFTLEPCCSDRLDYAKGHLDTPYGRIESGWEKVGTDFVYSFSVPKNTSAIFDGKSFSEGKYSFKL